MSPRKEPKPRPEVAERMHELRFQRYCILRTDMPRHKDSCAWCGGPKPSARHKWCSQECNSAALIRSNNGARQAVFSRDNGVCARCGFPSVDVEYDLISIAYMIPCGDAKAIAEFKGQWGPWWTNEGGWWQADHIIPVIKGGGCCGLENYQTLCLRCHKADTAELVKRKPPEGQGTIPGIV